MKKPPKRAPKTEIMNSRSRFLLLTLASAILFLGSIGKGDLTGYDDALYSTEAKNISHAGDWLNPSIRGASALEHPPLFVWTQAAFFLVFGISDAAAKAPAALAAIGTVLLVFWLARRLLRDTLAAGVAMFIMLATPYFIKYGSRAMTDVPTTFLFVCAMCAWLLRDRNPRWCVAAGVFTAMSLLTRGLIGIALLAVFAIDLAIDLNMELKTGLKIDSKLITRRELSRYLWIVTIALVPLTSWYAYALLKHPDFVAIHQGWLEREVYGSLTPPWRRYTGVIEYAFMLLKSYWPWLPAMVAGIVLAYRGRRRELYPLLSWVAVVFVLCAITRSRVLRYMLPAYPAFSILAASSISKLAPRRILESAMNWIPPAAVAAALGIALLWKPHWQATDIKPIARAASELPGQLVGLYDEGQPRWDEANQLEWYGDCHPQMLIMPGDLTRALLAAQTHTFVIDRRTYESIFKNVPNSVILESNHLIYIRLH
jgi:4-amino-4-deoxy-L-arabinose transferase-like glycosyltransferase